MEQKQFLKILDENKIPYYFEDEKEDVYEQFFPNCSEDDIENFVEKSIKD